jgi:hypothetical protein
MPDQSHKITFIDRLLGPLYAFLYITVRKRFIGVSIAGWLKNIPWLFALLALPTRLGIGWVIAGFLLAIFLRILYWQGKRSGYIRFIVQDRLTSPERDDQLAANQKIDVRASGIFSVHNWQSYVRQHPAQYWRVAMGDHAVMVKFEANRYLYQFIQPDSMESIIPGMLFSGRHPEPALEISFLSDWGPEAPAINYNFFSSVQEEERKRLARKIYLAFDDIETRSLVWNGFNHTEIKDNK